LRSSGVRSAFSAATCARVTGPVGGCCAAAGCTTSDPSRATAPSRTTPRRRCLRTRVIGSPWLRMPSRRSAQRAVPVGPAPPSARTVGTRACLRTNFRRTRSSRRTFGHRELARTWVWSGVRRSRSSSFVRAANAVQRRPARLRRHRPRWRRRCGWAWWPQGCQPGGGVPSSSASSCRRGMRIRRPIRTRRRAGAAWPSRSGIRVLPAATARSATCAPPPGPTRTTNDGSVSPCGPRPAVLTRPPG
jgi:hypothetical protein